MTKHKYFLDSDLLGVGKEGLVKCAKGDYGNITSDIKTVVKKDTNVLLLIKDRMKIFYLKNIRLTMFASFSFFSGF